MTTTDNLVLGEKGTQLIALTVEALGHILYPGLGQMTEEYCQVLCGKYAEVPVTVTLGSGGVCRTCARRALRKNLPMTDGYRAWLLAELGAA